MPQQLRPRSSVNKQAGGKEEREANQLKAHARRGVDAGFDWMQGMRCGAKGHCVRSLQVLELKEWGWWGKKGVCIS
jgi:hypothetical protein